MSGNSRRNVLILSLTLVVVMLGFGIVIPITPFYLENLGAGGTELGLLVACYAVMRLIFGPIWGSVSDRVGRKPVLMVGIVGYGLTMVLFGMATKLWMLFVIRSLSGILSSATSPTTMAYISDSTPAEKRGGGMGALGAAMGIGTILGPGLGGLLASDSLSLPFFIAGGLSFLSLLLIWLFLPESLPAANRKPAAKAQRLGLRTLWQSLLSPIGVLLVMGLLVSFASTSFYSILGLYALAKFDYGPEEVGGIMMVVGVVTALTQGLLVGPLSQRWGETALIKGALLGTAAAFVGIALAAGPVVFLLAVGFFTLATALMAPAVMSLTSQRATLEQGITMGLSNAFMSLGRIGGPALAGPSFDLNIEYPNYGSALVIGGRFCRQLVLAAVRAAGGRWGRHGA